MDALYRSKVLYSAAKDSLVTYAGLVSNMQLQVLQRDSIIVLVSAQRDNRALDLIAARELLSQVEVDIKKANRAIKWLKVQRAILTGVCVGLAAVIVFTSFGSN